MATRYFSLVYGIVFLVVGIAGFVPGLVTTQMEATPGMVEHGLLFGLFPVNTLHNLVHLVFGVWGIAGYRSVGNAIIYARSVTVVYAVLAIFGLFPGLNTLFGLVPLFGHDIWLHVVLAAVAAYFGFFSRPAERPVSSRV